jgi:hypothetical protein
VSAPPDPDPQGRHPGAPRSDRDRLTLPGDEHSDRGGEPIPRAAQHPSRLRFAGKIGAFVEVTMRCATVVRQALFSAAFLVTLGRTSAAHAQIAVGEWARTDAAGGGMSMTVAACCGGGYRLTYHVPVQGGQPLTLTVDLPMNGTEVPVMSGGKPTGQTMSARRVDDHHYTGAMKQNGQLSLTNTATLSADGKTLTVVDTMSAGKQVVTEVWARK